MARGGHRGVVFRDLWDGQVDARARPHRPDWFRRRGHQGSCDARRTASVALRRAALIALDSSLPRVSAAGTIGRMDDRVALGVYFLIAAAAAFVTAARTLPVPVLLLVLLALGIAAALVRARVLTLRGGTRATIGFIAVYLVTFFAMAALLRP